VCCKMYGCAYPKPSAPSKPPRNTSHACLRPLPICANTVPGPAPRNNNNNDTTHTGIRYQQLLSSVEDVAKHTSSREMHAESQATSASERRDREERLGIQVGQLELVQHRDRDHARCHGAQEDLHSRRRNINRNLNICDRLVGHTQPHTRTLSIVMSVMRSWSAITFGSNTRPLCNSTPNGTPIDSPTNAIFSIPRDAHEGKTRCGERGETRSCLSEREMKMMDEG